MTVNLGPRVPAVPNVPANPQANGLGYNPRCLRRDVNPYSAAVTADNYTSSLITGNKDLYSFQLNMLGRFELGQWGVHTGGHFTVGGDPAGVSGVISLPQSVVHNLKWYLMAVP